MLKRGVRNDEWKHGDKSSIVLKQLVLVTVGIVVKLMMIKVMTQVEMTK